MPQMQVKNDLDRFTLALEKNQSVVVDKNGFWKRENFIYTFIRWIFRKEDQRLMDIGKVFSSCMDELEKTSVVFYVFDATPSERFDKQKTTFTAYIRAAEAVQKVMQRSKSPLVKARLNSLAQRVVALKYRIEAVHGGLDSNFKADSEVEKLAAKWKKEQKLFADADKALTPRDHAKIKEACCSPEFISLLKTNKALQKNFFSWIIRDNNDVNAFIQFPSTTARIKAAHLSVRVGRYASDLFAVSKKATTTVCLEKVLQLPFFNGKITTYPNILDDAKVVDLGGGLHLTIKKVIDIFEKKNEEIGNLEFFRKGITNWNSHLLGSLNPKTERHELVDLTAPEWWKAMPSFERLNKAEVEAKYRKILADGEWLVCAKASRQTHDLAYEGRHGYLEVAVPTAEGKYEIFPFGSFVTERYPGTAWEKISTLMNTVRGKIAYPDENVFYTHREHAHTPFVLTSEQGVSLMKKIRHDLIRAREGNTIFQFSGTNCAQWVTDVIESVIDIPNLYKDRFLGSMPDQPVIRRILKVFLMAPKFMQPSLVHGLLLSLGSWRGITVYENGRPIFKSAKTNPNSKTLTIFQAGLQHQQINEGKLPGFITFGN